MAILNVIRIIGMILLFLLISNHSVAQDKGADAVQPTAWTGSIADRMDAGDAWDAFKAQKRPQVVVRETTHEGVDPPSAFKGIESRPSAFSSSGHHDHNDPGPPSGGKPAGPLGRTP